MTCVKFRTRELEKSGGHGELFGLGRRAFEELFHSLGRHLAADRRVGSAAVVARLDELDRRMLGGVPGREASPVIHLIFERGEERLGNGVVLAAVGMAAGQAHVVGARPFGQKPASVLGAVIGVEYRVSRHVAARFGRRQRRHRDVAHKLVGGDGAVEVAPHQVGPAPGLGVGNGVRFPALGARPRIPSSRTLYRVRLENSAGRKHFTDRARPRACGGGPGPIF